MTGNSPKQNMLYLMNTAVSYMAVQRTYTYILTLSPLTIYQTEPNFLFN